MYSRAKAKGNSFVVMIFVFISLLLAAGAYFSLVISKPEMKIEKIASKTDKNGNGILDSEEILTSTREQIKSKARYVSKYYAGGYPPDNEGVCSDVIWRAYSNAGYDIKGLIDNDIKNHPSDYPEISKADPNIDFRRVKNLYRFFKKYADDLTIQVKPNDYQNLVQWQGGDIVVLKNTDHIAIVSDRRRKDGVPFIIHNANKYPKEEDKLVRWKGKIIGHFRFPRQTVNSNH